MSRNRFCQLMKINRSTLYYERQGESEENLSTYIPMKRGFMYLYAIIDVYIRYIVGWRLRNTLEKANCIKLLKECVERLKSSIRTKAVNTPLQTGYRPSKSMVAWSAWTVAEDARIIFG